LAIGPLIDAADEEIAYAVTTIFTFNIIALIVYPLLGHALHLSPVAFGSWTGAAVNDTSVVVATGYVYGKSAGATATVVKLTRTLLLVPLAFALGTAYAARRGGGSSGTLSARTLSKAILTSAAPLGALARHRFARLALPWLQKIVSIQFNASC
jgi:uncharacterized membrane protein YadS